MHRQFLILFFFIFIIGNSVAQSNPDSVVAMIVMDEFVISSIKQGLELKNKPLSADVLHLETIERNRTVSIKDASHFAPNLYIPDYGSRITSSIYVRGMGARIDNPVIGLNVDNVPYINKNAFDTDIIDISRIEMIRGSQSTLYGRNTMAGVINIYTLSPLSYQGVRAGVEFANGGTYKARVSFYDKLNEKFGYSLGASFATRDGFFRNEYTDELLDWERSGSGRLKLQYHPKNDVRINNTTSVNYTKQGGYPYMNVETETIAYNDTSSYQRLNITNGLTVHKTTDWGNIASITSYSYLDDAMRLDQDFTTDPYFTLLQAQEEHSISEDLVFTLDKNKRYKALFGLYAMYKNQKMDAPVNFKEFGIKELILKNMNSQLAPYYYKWNDDNFLLNSEFKNSVTSGALYHESKYEYGRWYASASLRLAYEYNYLDYSSFAESSATLYDKNDQVFLEKDINVNRKGNVGLSSFIILPKATLMYKLGENKQNNVYASAGRGYKAGGFNTQMFSDILQQEVMKEFGVGSSYDVDEIISYDPEYNWTYEVGAHFENKKRSVMIDASLFYIDCYNQQLTVFPEGQTTGRMMTNAGETRSYGAEVSAKVEMLPDWWVEASYGYTNARFIKYKSGLNDYKGKYVPYAPMHTLHIGTNYTLDLGKNNLIFDINTNGVGRLYWNEDNDIYQPFYMLLNSSITFELQHFSISAWGNNTTNQDYNVFYFKSIGREFVQRGLGATYGVSANINF